MKERFICPMHPEVRSAKADNCPKCGMKLVLQKEGSEQKQEKRGLQEYTPLIIIITLILLVTVSLSSRDVMFARFSVEQAMRYFMAGFFLVFSGFKLLDLKGFAEGYATYDLLARKWYGYGFVYPFIELFFGISYTIGYQPDWLHIFVAIVMGFSSIGVFRKLLKKQQIHCACLGTFLKVPLTKVTLVEDIGMAGMALIMIVV